ILKCPAAPDARPNNWVSDYTVSDTIASTAYAATQMPGSPPYSLTDSFWVRRSGTALHTYPGINPNEVTDGLSNTFILVEDVGRPDLYVYGQKRNATGGSNAEWADPNNRLTVE